MFRVIKINKIQCNYCGEIIESKSNYDFKRCKCGAVAVAGGYNYLKRAFLVSKEDYTELSDYSE